MRDDLKDLMLSLPLQGSDEWKMSRLGKFTGSQVGRLMKRGRGKDALWSVDALSYISSVTKDRKLQPIVTEDPDQWEKYCWYTDKSSRAIEWGHDTEDEARTLYMDATGFPVDEIGSIPHPALSCFADSPDGIILDYDGALEIKCQFPDNHIKSILNVRDGRTLKEYNDTYYWQCMAHMAVTGAAWCDWVTYCPWETHPFHLVTIVRDDDAIAELESRIALAETEVNAQIDLLKKLVNTKHSSGDVS